MWGGRLRHTEKISALLDLAQYQIQLKSADCYTSVRMVAELMLKILRRI